MIEAITYCSDVEKLQPCGLLHRNDDDESLFFEGSKTPTIRNGVETMALVRVESEQLLIDSGLAVLASCEIGGDAFAAVFADPDAAEIYNRVYDQTPTTSIDDDGIEHTHTPPQRFGAFA